MINNENKNIPVFWGHGEKDQVIKKLILKS